MISIKGVKIDNRVVTLELSSALVPGEIYSVTVASGTIQSVKGFKLLKPYTFKFRVQLSAEAFTATITPADQKLDVPINTNILVNFSEAPNQGSVTKDSFKVTAKDGVPIKFNAITWKDDKNVSFNLPIFERATTYTIQLEGITTPNKAKEVEPLSTAFTTSANLVITESWIPQSMTGPNHSIILDFDEEVDLATIKAAGAFLVEATPASGGASTPLNGTFRDKANLAYPGRVIFESDSAFSKGSTISITIAASVADIKGATLGAVKKIDLKNL